MPCPGGSLGDRQMPGVQGGWECARPAAPFKAHRPLGFLWLPCPLLSPLLAQTPSGTAVDAFRHGGRRLVAFGAPGTSVLGAGGLEGVTCPAVAAFPGRAALAGAESLLHRAALPLAPPSRGRLRGT